MNHRKASLAAAIAAMSVALLAPSGALAQTASARQMVPAGPVSQRSVSPAARPAATSGVRVNVNGGRSVASARVSPTSTTRHSQDALGLGGVPLSLQDLLNITPSNGFDWQYVNSINQDLAVKALIDPVTQLEVAQAERLLRRTGGAFTGAYILGGGGYYVPPEQVEGSPPSEEQAQPAESQPAQPSQPQIIVLQQAPAQQPAVQNKMEAPPQEELPDRGPFTLVLRNGKQVQAVAFTHSRGKIVYITPDGGRLTLDAAELDAEATTRINEERGTPLQLPL